MNKIIIILLSCVYLFATSCEKDVEYHYTTILTFENKSSHVIEIKVDAGNNREQESWNCIIKSDESFSHLEGGVAPGIIWYIMDGGCRVTFDGEITADHRNSDIAHNLCDENSYTVMISGRHNTKAEYTYTFTDEDYNRAVAVNKESGE